MNVSKCISLFLVLLFLYSPIFGQDYKVKWGPAYKKEGGIFSSFELIGIEKDNYYMLMRPRKSNTLLAYDMNHKLVSNRSLDFRFGKEKLYLNQLVRTTSGTFGYFSVRDKKSNTWRVMTSKFQNGKFGKVELAYKHKFDVKWKFYPLFFALSSYSNADVTGSMKTSKDSTHVAFLNILSTKDDKNAENLAIAVFDADMKLLWKKTQKFKYADKDIRIVQSVVANNGDIYAIAKLYKKRKDMSKEERKKKGLPRFDYKVFKITENDLSEITVKIGQDLAPTDAGLFFPDGNTDEFILAGFYTDANKKSGLKGLFFSKGNPSTKEITAVTHKFEDEFLTDLVREKDIEKDRGLGMSFNIKNLLQFGNGNIGLIAEEYYITTHTTTDSNGRMRTYYTYHTNDLVIPRFNAEGELLNIQKVEKAFRSRASIQTSYSLALANGKIYLLFNDLKTKGERKDLKKKGKNGKKRAAYTDMTVINSEGEIEYQQTLFNSRETELFFVPYLSDYSASKFLIGSISPMGKKYAFGTIDLK